MATSTPTSSENSPSDELGPSQRDTGPTRPKGAIAGVVAAAVALGVGELIAGLLAPTPGLVAAVSNRVVDSAPAAVTEFGKDVFGLNQKAALTTGTAILSLLIAAVLGIASLRRIAVGAIGFAAFGLLGASAIGADAQGSPIAGVVTATLAVLAGLATLSLLIGLADATPLHRPDGVTVARRGFLATVLAGGAAALFANLIGRTLRARTSAEEARSEVELVGADESEEVASQVASAAGTEVASTPGITPIVVANDDFYRIDTAILVPQVDPESWELTIGGLVDNPRTYGFTELVERASVIEPVTLSCVSNEVGGGLVGNAVWQGVPLTELLDEVGVQAGATQIKSQSVDGWNCGFPTDLAYDGRTALVAVAMNGEALPIEHGFPVRLVVSGLYGYVSATKWLESIELTTLEDFDGYWIPRGWSKDGPVKTQSRIDTPRNGNSLTAGVETSIAGVAWAPNIGIDRVEVQIDDGPWQEAELGESLGINAWRQWRVRWSPVAGPHRLRVRATDSSGFTQPEERTPVAPDGATGWHTIVVDA